MFDYFDTPVVTIFEFLITLIGNEYQVKYFFIINDTFLDFLYRQSWNFFGGKTKTKISGSILKEVMFFVLNKALL